MGSLAMGFDTLTGSRERLPVFVMSHALLSCTTKSWSRPSRFWLWVVSIPPRQPALARVVSPP